MYFNILQTYLTIQKLLFHQLNLKNEKEFSLSPFVLADVLGAIGGAIVGGAIAGGPGAVFGGVVSGMGASFEAHDRLYNRGIVEIDREVIDTLTFRYNIANSYDSMGTWHNGGLDILTRE